MMPADIAANLVMIQPRLPLAMLEELLDLLASGMGRHHLFQRYFPRRPRQVITDLALGRTEHQQPFLGSDAAVEQGPHLGHDRLHRQRAFLPVLDLHLTHFSGGWARGPCSPSLTCIFRHFSGGWAAAPLSARSNGTSRFRLWEPGRRRGRRASR